MSESRFITVVIDREAMAEWGRQGAAVVHARHDGKVLTKNARAAFDQRFITLADPRSELAPEELACRVAELRRAYFSAIGTASARARRANRAPP